MLLMLVNLLGLESDEAKGVFVVSVIVLGFMIVALISLVILTIMDVYDERH